MQRLKVSKKTKQDLQRDLIQSRAVISSAKHKHLVLEWSTGCGKSLASIKIIEAILKDNPSATGYIVCKESTHKKNWIDDVKKHGYGHILNNITLLLYASAKKMSKCDFIILDECHGLTPKRMAVIKNFVDKNTAVIYLSATIEKQKKYLISEIARYTEKYYKISLLKAIELELLPEPEIVIHRVKLENNSTRNNVFLMKKGTATKAHKAECDYHQRWDVFGKYQNIHLSVRCNEQEYYDLITDQMNYNLEMSRSGPTAMRTPCKNKFLNLGSKRKKFIAKAKSAKARRLVEEFRSESYRFVCFTGSIEQSVMLGSESSVNSKNSKEYNQELIDCFNRQDCSELFAVKMLRESVNLTDIQKGIVVQLDSTIGSFYQMLGRCLRHEFPQMHLLILEDTQDEVYFASAMKDFDLKFIKDE